MSHHLIILDLDDEYDDIQTEADLENFVWDLKSSTHAHMTARWWFNIGPSVPENEED